MDTEIMQCKAKVDTFPKDNGFGCRLSFLFEDKSPEIFEKLGFSTEEDALKWGQKAVLDTFAQLPGAEVIEEQILH